MNPPQVYMCSLHPSLTFPRQLEDRSPVEFGPSLSAEHTSLFILIQETKKKSS